MAHPDPEDDGPRRKLGAAAVVDLNSPNVIGVSHPTGHKIEEGVT
jgi:hypothetical protein